MRRVDAVTGGAPSGRGFAAPAPVLRGGGATGRANSPKTTPPKTAPPKTDAAIEPQLLFLGIAGAATGALEVALLFPWWLTIVAMLEVVVGAVVLAHSR